MPLSESTMAIAGPSASRASTPARIATATSSGSAPRPSSTAPRPSLGLRPAASRAAPCSAKTAGKKARTACPKRIGSDTFIIVALRCSENSTPLALASAICSVRNRWSAATRITVASTTSPASTATACFSTVVVPSVAAELDAERSGRADRDRPLVRPEVVDAHGGDVGLGVGGPGAHRVRVLAGVGLHRGGGPAIGVALAQDRVHGAALHPVVAGPDLALLVGGGLVGVVGEGVALGLELGDGGLQLGDRGADVGQLDDVRLGRAWPARRARRGGRRSAARAAGAPGSWR